MFRNRWCLERPPRPIRWSPLLPYSETEVTAFCPRGNQPICVGGDEHLRAGQGTRDNKGSNLGADRGRQGGDDSGDDRGEQPGSGQGGSKGAEERHEGAVIGANASQGNYVGYIFYVTVRFDDGSVRTFAYRDRLPFRTGDYVLWTPRGLFHRWPAQPAPPGPPPPPAVRGEAGNSRS